jgi:hypothetical protein
MKHNIYRDGKVYVCAKECATCIFRPGNLMQLRAGRVRQMVDDAKADESTIVCHKTLTGDNAVCRGFYDRYPTQPLQIAERLGLVCEIDPDVV